jgi:hypothetical protein
MLIRAPYDADVEQPIPYAVVKIPARAVDADDVSTRDQGDMRCGRIAVLVQDLMRAGISLSMERTSVAQSFAAADSVLFAFHTSCL